MPASFPASAHPIPPQLSTTIDWREGHANRDRPHPELLARDGELHVCDEVLSHTEGNAGASLLTPTG